MNRRSFFKLVTGATLAAAMPSLPVAPKPLAPMETTTIELIPFESAMAFDYGNRIMDGILSGLRSAEFWGLPPLEWRSLPENAQHEIMRFEEAIEYIENYESSC